MKRLKPLTTRIVYNKGLDRELNNGTHDRQITRKWSRMAISGKKYTISNFENRTLGIFFWKNLNEKNDKPPIIGIN